MRFTILCSALALLTACGGSGGGGAFIPGPAEFTTIVNDHRAIEDSASSADISNPSAIPPGSATFEGFIILDTDPAVGNTNEDGQVYYSPLSVDVNFDDSSLSGSANTFWYYDEVAAGPDAETVGGNISISSDPASFNDGTGFLKDFAVSISGDLELSPGDGVTGVDSGASGVLGAFAGTQLAPQAGAETIEFFAGTGVTEFSDGTSLATRIITEIQ